MKFAITLLQQLVTAYVADAGQKTLPGADADFLDAFKVLVKGDSTWNAIRDNCREFVYYRNCINMGRRDALPKVPEKWPCARRGMFTSTSRHVVSVKANLRISWLGCRDFLDLILEC